MIQCYFMCFFFVMYYGYFIIGSWYIGQVEDFYWNGWICFQYFVIQFVMYCVYMVIFEVVQNNVVFVQSIFVNQNGSYWIMIFIKEGFDDCVVCYIVVDCFQFKNFSLQQDCVQQVVDVGICFCGNVDKLVFVVLFFWQDVVLGQFVFYVIWIGFWFIDFVYCYYYWYLCCFSVLDSFDSLWYYVVVCCYYQNYDICCLCVMSMYGGKCGVVWGIQEGDYVVVGFDVVSIDVLGNIICFVGGNFGRMNVVQQ